jgi:hypothetical protein
MVSKLIWIYIVATALLTAAIQFMWSKFSKRKEKQIEQELGPKSEAIGSEPIAFEPKTKVDGFELHFRATGLRVLWHRRAPQVGESHAEEASRVERGLSLG